MSEADIARILERLSKLDEKISGIHIQLVAHIAATDGERGSSRNWLNIMLAVGMLVVTALSAYGAFLK